MLNKIKLWLGLETHLQQYARSMGYQIKRVRRDAFELYSGNKLLGRFPSELAASTKVYYLVAWQGYYADACVDLQSDNQPTISQS
jgi:hypothetical protein